MAAAKQKFGIDGLVEFGKSTVKLGIVSLILYTFLAGRLEEILASLYLTPAMSAALMARLVLEFLLIVVLIQLALGGVDYLWQVFRHRQRNRMSRKEMMDEFKDSEGDPHLKSARRQRAQEVATNRMLTDVASANVVVVNPTHYTITLKWDRSKGGAPVCVAKGVDEIARKIRERAAEHGVPIHSDPPTARAIHATVEIGQEIRVEHYRAVAAIRFAEAMRRRGPPEMTKAKDLRPTGRSGAADARSPAGPAAQRRGRTGAQPGAAGRDQPGGPGPAEDLAPVLAGKVALTYDRWAEARRSELNLVIARQTAGWMDAQSAAQGAFGRVQALQGLAERLKARR